MLAPSLFSSKTLAVFGEDSDCNPAVRGSGTAAKWPKASATGWGSCGCRAVLPGAKNGPSEPKGVEAVLAWNSVGGQSPAPAWMQLHTVGPSSVPAFCDSSVPAGIRSFLPAWWAQMSQIDGGPLCSKLHKCSTHKYCVGTDDLRCFGALQLLENILRTAIGVYYGSRAVRCGICVFCIFVCFQCHAQAMCGEGV